MVILRTLYNGSFGSVFEGRGDGPVLLSMNFIVIQCLSRGFINDR